MYAVSRIVLTKARHREEFLFADHCSCLAKLLYNAALFRMRQAFTGWGKETLMANEEAVFSEIRQTVDVYPDLKIRNVLSYKALEKIMHCYINQCCWRRTDVEYSDIWYKEKF